MPRVECPHSGCKYNSSNIVGYGGECTYQGKIRLVQIDHDNMDDYVDCKQFTPKSLSEMVSQWGGVQNSCNVVPMPRR